MMKTIAAWVLGLIVADQLFLHLRGEHIKPLVTGGVIMQEPIVERRSGEL